MAKWPSPVMVRAAAAAVAEAGPLAARQHMGFLEDALRRYRLSAGRDVADRSQLAEWYASWREAWQAAGVAAESSLVAALPAWARDCPAEVITAHEAALLAGVSVQYLRRLLNAEGDRRLPGYRDRDGHWHTHLPAVISYAAQRKRARDASSTPGCGRGGGAAVSAVDGQHGDAGERERGAGTDGAIAG